MAALPIMITREFAFGVKLILKADDGWRHQSLWSRLLKVAAWNELNGNELAYVFGAEIFCQHWLLSKPRMAQWRKLRHFLRASDQALSQAYPPFLLPVPVGQMPATRLRGCRRCYQMGFHSILYQLPFLGRCPLHGEPIVDGCPQCAHPLPYAIPGQLRRTGCECPACHNSIINLEDKPEGKSPDYNKFRHWRQSFVKGLPKQGAAPSRASAWLEAYRQWNLHYAEIPQRPFPSGQTGISCLQLESAEGRRVGEAAICEYYRMRRVHRHLLGKSCQRRYDGLIRQTGFFTPGSEDDRLIAYLFWRLAWERSLAMDRMGANFRKNHFPITAVCLLLSHPRMDSGELFGQICQEMRHSYRRCQLLVRWMRSRGGVLLNLSVMVLVVPELGVRQVYKKYR